MRAPAETTNPIRLFCLYAPFNGAHMAVSVFARWLVAPFSQWEKLQLKATASHRLLLFLSYFFSAQSALNLPCCTRQ